MSYCYEQFCHVCIKGRLHNPIIVAILAQSHYCYNSSRTVVKAQQMGNMLARLLGDGREAVDKNVPFPVSEMITL